MTPAAWSPRPYQRAIVQHILQHPRCAVWAGMGMGKTSATLTALSVLEPVLRGPALILAPLRVATGTWPQECDKWEHLRTMRPVVPICGGLQRRLGALRDALDEGAHCAINYENIPWLVEQLGASWPFDAIIADESTRLKSYRARQGSQRAAALAKVAHKSAHFVELTGTPSPNGLQDLWGQAWFLDGGQRLGRSFRAFTSRWFQSIPMGSHPAARELRPLPHAQQQIQAALADLALTVQPEDYFDVSAPIVNIVRVQLPSRARKIYRDMERELFAELESGALEAANAAARTTKCLQIASGACWQEDYVSDMPPGHPFPDVARGGKAAGKSWRELHDAKLDALESIAEETAGAPLLVRYHFQHSLARIRKRFPHARVLDKKPQTMADWNAGRIPMLLAHAGAAGHGLNLQDGGCHYVAFENSWSLEEHQQITERIGPVRQMQSGHPRPVWHYHITAEGTLDEAVLERLQHKRSVQDALLNTMKKEK